MHTVIRAGMAIAQRRTFAAALSQAARLLVDGAEGIQLRSPHGVYTLRWTDARPGHHLFLRKRGGFVVAEALEAHQDLEVHHAHERASAPCC